MPSGTKLTFYGGVNEIGGNKILLEDKDTRVFLDFGKGFSRLGLCFEEYFNPWVPNGISDFLTMELIPDIEGVYRDDLMTIAGRKCMEPDIDAVLLSHAHADHADYISFLHPKIPVYMGQTTLMMLNAIDDNHQRDFEMEIINFLPRPSKRGERAIPRRIETFRSGKKFKVGSLEVHPIHVDHSIPGAYGFIIYTSSGPVVYSGDDRLHGTKPEMTREFVEEAKVSKPVALICEGTRIKEEPTDESESKVYEDSQDVIARAKQKLVFVDFNFKDVDRVRTFYRLAKENGKKFVVRIKDCYFLKHLYADPNLNMPNYDDKDIVIYKPKQASGTYSNGDYTGEDAVFANQPNAKTAQELAQDPGRYICALGYYSFTSLVDIKPLSGSIYIHSASEPYNEEQVVSQDRVDNWLDRFHMNKFQIHCSGHAKGSDLFDIVRQIDAQTLFPVHTEYPEMYVRATRKIRIVEEGIEYAL